LYTIKGNGGKAPTHTLDTKFQYTHILLMSEDNDMQLKLTWILEIQLQSFLTFVISGGEW